MLYGALKIALASPCAAGRDLAPLLDALARKSDPSSDGTCMTMLEHQPEIFLVDAGSRAV